MKNKIVIFNIIIIALSLIAVFVSGISINKNSHYEEAEKEIIRLTEIYAANYDDKITENVPKGIRVTVIDDTFKVIADSEDDSVVGSFHTNREEIEKALSGTPEVIKRYSSSLKKDLVYYALKVNTGSSYVFVRVAIPVESVNEYTTKTVPIMILVLVAALVISFAASIFATNELIKPIKSIKYGLMSVNEGNFEKINADSYDKEVNDVISEINGIGEKLQSSIKKESDDRNKLDYILNNVSDGIIVISEDKTINLINNVAKEIFGISVAEGKNYSVLTENAAFNDSVSEFLKDGKNGCFQTEIDGKYYMVSLKNLEKGFKIVVLSDVTAMKNGEVMRSEFFANASHELKTPLTAIKGFNEIISLKTKEEETKELSFKIDGQITRLINLINDMLKLSELEAEKEPVKEKVDLVKVAAEVKENLSALSDKKDITVTVEGEGTVEMEKEHAEELVKNLMENAVRYNNNGGYVKATVKSYGGKVIFTVEDNGIGIEEKDLNRIFERFYRVNKSRSRETGGTGLGLSIVKHVCSLYSADLEIKSGLGAGTTIKVIFNG
ncbi:MAG: ATP-binding protein [Candidatus Borkfalkiaceae bacterium]|nr:ATP-binding protein [Christensenellaceae bacterium]